MVTRSYPGGLKAEQGRKWVGSMDGVNAAFGWVLPVMLGCVRGKTGAVGGSALGAGARAPVTCMLGGAVALARSRVVGAVCARDASVEGFI